MSEKKEKNTLYFFELLQKMFTLVFTGIVVLFIISFLLPTINKNLSNKENNNFKNKYIGVVQINSIITQPFVDKTMGNIKKHLNNDNLAGLLFIFSSPGGDPTASHNFMSYLKDLKKDINLFGYINKSCTSGCYYSAIGLDKISISKNSIVGSVGVLMQMYDFSEFSKNIGVQEKTLMVGDYKKPFSSLNGITKENETYIKENMLLPIYENFVQDVILERKIEGNKVDITNKYFNGKVFVGNNPSIMNVLIDEVVDFHSYKKNIISEYGLTEDSLNFVEIKDNNSFDFIKDIKKNLQSKTQTLLELK